MLHSTAIDLLEAERASVEAGRDAARKRAETARARERRDQAIRERAERGGSPYEWAKAEFGITPQTAYTVLRREVAA